MIWNLMGSIGGKVLDIMDIDEADRLKFEVQTHLIEIKEVRRLIIEGQVN